MAGIGFSIKKILRGEALNHVTRAYLYAGVIIAGPWLMAVCCLHIIGLIVSKNSQIEPMSLLQFQVSITYLFAISLIISGFMQYAYTRFISDRIYEHKLDLILPNTFALLIIASVVTFPIGFLYAYFMLPETPLLYRVVTVFLLVTLTDIWLLATLLNGLKKYRKILYSFFCGYGLSIAGCYFLYWNLSYMMLGFYIGQALLLIAFIYIITKNYLTSTILSFRLIERKTFYPYLALAGALYNLAIWADKFVFWFSDETGQIIIGHLQASYIYDMPMYLSFFFILPGLTAFLFRMETDFAFNYESYYHAITHGGNLTQIRWRHKQMVESAREGLVDVLRIQIIFTLVGFLYSEELLSALGQPIVQSRLFRIDILSANMVIIFISLLNLNFYLDKRKEAMQFVIVFFLSNVLFSMLSIKMGVYYYGYGFLLSLILTNFISIVSVNHTFKRLTFSTFME